MPDMLSMSHWPRKEGINLPWTCNSWVRGSMHTQIPIDLIHISQNVPVHHPTMLHSEHKCAHLFSDWSIVVYGTGAFWDLCNWSIRSGMFCCSAYSHFVIILNEERISWRYITPTILCISLFCCNYLKAFEVFQVQYEWMHRCHHYGWRRFVR